ncbi:hypothetical protein MHK_007210, partial [Candidatus Magnetomorum sp. HK-1]
MEKIRYDQKKQLNQASIDGKCVQCTCPQKEGGPSEDQKKNGLNIEINIYNAFNNQFEHIKLFKGIKCKIYLDTGDVIEETVNENGKIICNERLFINDKFKLELEQPPVAYSKSDSCRKGMFRALSISVAINNEIGPEGGPEGQMSKIKT